MSKRLSNVAGLPYKKRKKYMQFEGKFRPQIAAAINKQIVNAQRSYNVLQRPETKYFDVAIDDHTIASGADWASTEVPSGRQALHLSPSATFPAYGSLLSYNKHEPARRCHVSLPNVLRN